MIMTNIIQVNTKKHDDGNDDDDNMVSAKK